MTTAVSELNEKKKSIPKLPDHNHKYLIMHLEDKLLTYRAGSAHCPLLPCSSGIYAKSPLSGKTTDFSSRAAHSSHRSAQHCQTALQCC